jgi:hypothetical protein
MLPNTDKEVRTIVQWNEQINFEYPTDISQQNAYRLIANTGFTIKGWMYKPYHDPVGKIYKIDTTFSALSSVFGSFYGLSSQQNAYNTDAFTISARPFIRKVTPYLIPSNTNDINISIMGNMFQFVSSLYISANNNMFGELSNIDLYSSNNKLSAIYPPFSGILINNWNIEGNNVINFTLPSASTNGKFDIIVASEPGYGSLINDSRSISPSSIYRFPWEQGVDVFK